MRLRSFRRLLLVAASGVAVLAGAGLPAAAIAQSVQPSDPWPQAASDIPADSAIRFGILPNGMKYAILRNATPPGQASLRLRIDAGSLNETPEQRGLAHFTEHMLFNGTKNIPENELLRTLERLGLAFGADTNAATYPDQTTYNLDLPRTNDETVDTALKIMREQVSDALMDPAAIDAERNVIVGEERLRNTPGLRSTKAQFELLAPGQRVSDLLPIGDLNVIRTAPAERFVEFYRAYYRPSRATMIAVGDFDVDQMETKIRDAFQDWAPVGPDGPDPDLGTVAPRQAEARILVEPGIQSVIQLIRTKAPDLDPDTTAERREETVRGLGLAVLSRRLGELSRTDNPPFLFGAAQAGTSYKSLDTSVVIAAFNPGGQKLALETIEQEQRRLLQFGVSEAELQREILETRTALQNAVATAGTRTTPGLAGGLTASTNADVVFTAPQTNLDLFNAAVEGLTPDQVNAAVREAYDGQGPLLLVTSPAEIEGGEAALMQIITASAAVPVTAPTAQVTAEWPYADFGAAGVPGEPREIAELGATVVAFPNGVTLTVKPTTFRDDQILISVQTGIGEFGMPTDAPQAQSMAAAVYTAGGLGKLTADELNRTLNGKVYGAGFAIGEDGYQLSGATRPEDLDLQMQVLAAYLTDPGLRPAPFEQIKGLFPQIIAQQMATPSSAFELLSGELLASGDQREALPAPEVIAGWTNAQMAEQVKQGLSAGPIQIVMVGDVTLEAAIQSVATTFGALPTRAPAAAPLPGSDQRRFPAGTPEPVKLVHTGPAEQALGYIAWPTVDAVGDRTEARLVGVLASVIDLRATEEIREKQALAYSPGSGADASSNYAGYGSLAVRAETTPENLPAFFAAVDAIVADLRDTPVSDDELTRARASGIESLRRAQAGNAYWLGELQEVASRLEMVEQVTSAIPDFEAITPADIQRAARTYLKPDTAWRAQVTSSTAAAAPAAPAAQ